MSDAISIFGWCVLLYFVLLNVGYLSLNFIALFSLKQLNEEKILDDLPQVYSGLEMPITILVPAFNEEAGIVASIHSMLQLSYAEYEIIAINDGSKDGTMEVLKREFGLQLFPEAYRVQIPTQPIRGIYLSRLYPNLRVIDKENGGKADSLNAGINAARYPVFCGVDADSILQRDSLQQVVKPFMQDSTVVATGGTVRIANGCEVNGGFLTKVELPKNWLALFQVVEYLRAFLFGRLGWSGVNGMLIISGAFGLFRKDAVIAVGGYRSNTIGEDMELVVRLHRVLSKAGKAFRIVFVPHPVCWTEAPEDMRTLKNQRIRWQRGLAESLSNNASLLFSRKGGAAGWLAFPFMLLFEGVGPVIELLGYGLTFISALFGWVSWSAFAIFLFVAIGLGILLSISGMLLEELSFHLYLKRSHLSKLLIAAILENFGYRQINTIWRLQGLWRWARGKEGQWGVMKRKGTGSSS